MSENKEVPQTTPTGLQKALTVTFKICLIAFLLLGTILVVGQLIGLIIGNGALTQALAGALDVPTTVAAALAGLLGFAMSYVFHWKISD